MASPHDVSPGIDPIVGAMLGEPVDMVLSVGEAKQAGRTSTSASTSDALYALMPSEVPTLDVLYSEVEDKVAAFLRVSILPNFLDGSA